MLGYYGDLVVKSNQDNSLWGERNAPPTGQLVEVTTSTLCVLLLCDQAATIRAWHSSRYD